MGFFCFPVGRVQRILFPYTLKVRYPENARSSDQVEIVELVSQGWIEPLSEIIKEDE